MKWEDKIEMVKLLNNSKLKEATDFYLEHEDWDNWNDVQALSMYANGIALLPGAVNSCIGIEDKLKMMQSKDVYENLDFRAKIRLETLKEMWENNPA